MKKNLSRNNFNLERPSFLIKILKTYVFTQITVMLNSYKFAFSRIQIKSSDSTIKKRKKNLCTPYTARRNNIFIKKITKIQLFNLKCAILNRYTYESRNIEMINSEVTKNLR